MGTGGSQKDLSRQRIESIDAVRGLAMVLMALDHVRLFFHEGSLLYSPTDLDETNTAVFLTRWVTHMCAPAFVFLAGMGAYLRARRDPSRGATARYLALRGLWLVVLELTVVRWCWYFNLSYEETEGGILWMIGWTMIALAGLIYLPRHVIGLLAAAVIVLQHTWESVPDEAWGRWSWLWALLYSPETLQPWPNVDFDPTYTLLPWIGVLAAGWWCGSWARLAREDRRRRFLVTGGILLAAFFLLRAANVYGDPRPWSAGRSEWFTVLSFLNCTKYPASLLFLLMTLGATLLLLAWFDGASVAGRSSAASSLVGRSSTPSGSGRSETSSYVRVSRWLAVFGRTPLFYYILHLALIHALAVMCSLLQYGSAAWLFESPPWNKHRAPIYPPGYGYSLPVVYLVWALVVAILYPCCRWFSGVRRPAWLRRP